jgi:hypothetical protein
MIIDVFTSPQIVTPRHRRTYESLLNLGHLVSDVLDRTSLPRLMLLKDKIGPLAIPAYDKKENSAAFGVTNHLGNVTSLEIKNQQVIPPTFECAIDGITIESLFFPAYDAFSMASKFVERENNMFYSLLKSSVLESSVRPKNLLVAYTNVHHVVSKAGDVSIMCSEESFKLIESKVDEETTVYIVPKDDLPSRIYFFPPPEYFGVFVERQQVELIPYATTGSKTWPPPTKYIAWEQIGMAAIHFSNAHAIDIFEPGPI